MYLLKIKSQTIFLALLGVLGANQRGSVGNQHPDARKLDSGYVEIASGGGDSGYKFSLLGGGDSG